MDKGDGCSLAMCEDSASLESSDVVSLLSGTTLMACLVRSL